MLDDGAVACAFAREGAWHLGRVDPRSGMLDEVPTPYTDIMWLRAVPGGVVFVGRLTGGVALRRPSRRRDGRLHGAASRDVGDAGSRRWCRSRSRSPSRAPPAASPTGCTTRREIPDHAAPAGDQPPLIVRCHGGPTAAASATLDVAIQFWTSRGFAVVDVDYAGSSGYGRAYRQLLRGAWGVADVEDCVEAARFAVARGWADPRRLVVRGSSAGGFTVLCALAFHDVFAAGASYYGIGDLEALRAETHKFFFAPPPHASRCAASTPSPPRPRARGWPAKARARRPRGSSSRRSATSC